MGLCQVKGKGWRYDFTINGERFTKAWFPTKAAAIAAREAHKKELLKKSEKLQLNSGLETVMVEYLILAERRKAAKTLEYRKIVFRRFLRFCGNIEIGQITPDMIEKYLSTRPTNNNFNKDRTELNVLFNWAYRRGRIDRNPVFLIEKCPVEMTKKVIPTPEEMTKILFAAGSYRPFLLVIFHTLGRSDEILRLTWHDVSFEQKIIRLWSRKSAHGNMVSRDIPMSEALYDVLWHLYQKRQGDNLVFPNPATGEKYWYRRKLMHTVCKRAGVPYFGFHAIRHWVASYLYDRKKIGLAVVSKLLGHSNFQTTERYLQLIDPRLRDAISKLDENVNYGWCENESY